MRVAYLINQYPKVSHSFIRREILALEDLGVEVLRISLRGWNDELADAADYLERTRTRYVLRMGAPRLILAVIRCIVLTPVGFLHSLLLAMSLGWRSQRSLLIHLIYLAEACQISIWLKTEKVFHLHAHFGTNSAEIAMLTGVLAPITWSFTAHGPEEFDNVDSIGLREKIIRCNFVAAISSFGRSQLYRLVGHEHWAKIHVVPCGLNDAIYAAPPSPRPKPNRLVCVGRLAEQKGQLLLVEAAAALVKTGVDFEILIIGDGELRPQIEVLISRFQLGQRIRITGFLSNQEVLAEISAARALVLPSFAEGLPIVIMEAMAMGRPVLGTYVGGIPELVVPGVHGWLVPAGDVTALADALKQCLSTNVDILKEMGEAARARVSERHAIGTSAAQLIALFDATLSPSHLEGPASKGNLCAKLPKNKKGIIAPTRKIG